MRQEQPPPSQGGEATTFGDLGCPVLFRKAKGPLWSGPLPCARCDSFPVASIGGIPSSPEPGLPPDSTPGPLGARAGSPWESVQLVMWASGWFTEKRLLGSPPPSPTRTR